LEKDIPAWYKASQSPVRKTPCDYDPSFLVYDYLMYLIPFILAKKSEDTLEQLDKFRYEEAPEKYCQSNPEKKGQRQIVPLTSKDLQRMVAWKLYVLLTRSHFFLFLL